MSKILNFSLLFSLLMMVSCSDINRENSKSNEKYHVDEMNSSKEVFLRFLPNFGQWDISKVNFSIAQSQKRGFVASPSDRQTELFGNVEFSKTAWDAISSEFNWVEILPENIPNKLKAHIPKSSKYFVSLEFNSSFNNNPYLAHGYALVVDFENPIMFLLAHDLNTPIQ